jgi:molybdopterin-guanine dinucleotide biosynthesis protein A
LGRLAQHYPSERLLLCPVDMPWLTLEALNQLRQAGEAEPESLLLAHDGERAQPLLLVLPLAPALRHDLQHGLETGERRLQSWLARHPCREVRLDPRALCNVNRPEEWWSAPGAGWD